MTSRNTSENKVAQSITHMEMPLVYNVSISVTPAYFGCNLSTYTLGHIAVSMSNIRSDVDLVPSMPSPVHKVVTKNATGTIKNFPTWKFFHAHWLNT